MMLWLLATLSVVTISWGIAHRLKAVNPAVNCLSERLRILPDTLRLIRRLAADPTLPRGVRIGL